MNQVLNWGMFISISAIVLIVLFTDKTESFHKDFTEYCYRNVLYIKFTDSNSYIVAMVTAKVIEDLI